MSTHTTAKTSRLSLSRSTCSTINATLLRSVSAYETQEPTIIWRMWPTTVSLVRTAGKRETPPDWPVDRSHAKILPPVGLMS
jgi:hypothetical protein